MFHGARHIGGVALPPVRRRIVESVDRRGSRVRSGTDGRVRHARCDGRCDTAGPGVADRLLVGGLHQVGVGERAPAVLEPVSLQRYAAPREHAEPGALSARPRAAMAGSRGVHSVADDCPRAPRRRRDAVSRTRRRRRVGRRCGCGAGVRRRRQHDGVAAPRPPAAALQRGMAAVGTGAGDAIRRHLAIPAGRLAGDRAGSSVSDWQPARLDLHVRGDRRLLRLLRCLAAGVSRPSAVAPAGSIPRPVRARLRGCGISAVAVNSAGRRCRPERRSWLSGCLAGCVALRRSRLALSPVSRRDGRTAASLSRGSHGVHRLAAAGDGPVRVHRRENAPHGHVPDAAGRTRHRCGAW